jgi:hypothetical protein
MYLLMAGLIPAIVIQYRSLALVKVLSDNNQNQAQFNTVVPSYKEVDGVGVEPTTSASQSAGEITWIVHVRKDGRITYERLN